MRNSALSFRAQSLSNLIPDHAEINKRLLTEEDVNERQRLAQQISNVSLYGTEVCSEDWHSAFLLDDEFLLEMPSDQLDDAGRSALILCYGRVPDKPSESWSEDVINGLVGFAARIGRTVSDKNQKMARRGVLAILEAEKKNRFRMRRKMLWLTLLILLGVISILWMTFFKR